MEAIIQFFLGTWDKWLESPLWVKILTLLGIGYAGHTVTAQYLSRKRVKILNSAYAKKILKDDVEAAAETSELVLPGFWNSLCSAATFNGFGMWTQSKFGFTKAMANNLIKLGAQNETDWSELMDLTEKTDKASTARRTAIHKNLAARYKEASDICQKYGIRPTARFNKRSEFEKLESVENAYKECILLGFACGDATAAFKAHKKGAEELEKCSGYDKQAAMYITWSYFLMKIRRILVQNNKPDMDALIREDVSTLAIFGGKDIIDKLKDEKKKDEDNAIYNPFAPKDSKPNTYSQATS